jgi:NAD-dependent SIR2 family protein deacetylase
MSSSSKKDEEDKTVDDLVNQVQGLELGDSSNKETQDDDDDHAKDVKKVAQWIRESKNIIILSGAGVSCAAGIPDFRTPGTGLYDNLQKYNLPYPEAVFDVDFYRRKPQPFLSLAKELWPGLQHSPTLTHSFGAVLSQNDKLLRNYTQNIDGLEHLATIPEAQIVECHGHFRTASCIKCQKPMDGDKCKDLILNDATNTPPKCPKCKSFVKPDIVFFGEGLPERFHTLLSQDVEEVDLLLVIGTSLQVAPVSHIPQYVQCQRRVLINRDEVGDFMRDEDVVLLGDCDDVVMSLACELEWEHEVRTLHKKTKIKPKDDAATAEAK